MAKCTLLLFFVLSSNCTIFAGCMGFYLERVLNLFPTRSKNIWNAFP